MVLTVLEAQVAPDQAPALQAAYTAAGNGALPPGLVHTELVRDLRDPGRWRIQTWWTSREALEAMRSAGTPAGVLMFRAAGAEPTLSVFEIVDALPRATT
jgi:heme-degrading monooxygenase HmoA